MRDNENEISKACGFYVNDWHLTAMLLPYINKTINKNEKILTILQSSVKENIKELLSKMNLNKETQNKILEINWNSKPICKYNEIKTMIENVQAINIIIKGTEEYLTIVNKNIEKILNNITGKKVTIINCYDITKNEEIEHILDEHDFILNTSGIKRIEEVFTDYQKKNQKPKDKVV